MGKGRTPSNPLDWLVWDLEKKKYEKMDAERRKEKNQSGKKNN